MTSEAQTAANQQNAKRSTGPRTSHGKAQSRRNSLRHGLAVPILTDERWLAECEALALLYGADPGDPISHLECVRAAGAVLELRRIEAAEVGLLNAALRTLISDQPSDELLHGEATPIGGNKSAVGRIECEAQAFLALADQLTAFARYERIAFSHFRRSFGHFFAK